VGVDLDLCWGAADPRVLYVLYLQAMLLQAPQEEGRQEGPQGDRGAGGRQDPRTLHEGKGTKVVWRVFKGFKNEIQQNVSCLKSGLFYLNFRYRPART